MRRCFNLQPVSADRQSWTERHLLQFGYARRVDAAGTWIGVGLALVGLSVAILAYRNRQPKTRLEYFIATNSTVLPDDLPESFYLAHGDTKILNPAITIIRIVNTGDKAIPSSSFETDLQIRLRGVSEVVSANCVARRPADLQPTLEVRGDMALLKPLLINAGDMLEVQLLSAGQASNVEISGRISDLSIARRATLPYPPGSGPNGEFAGPVDYFMWFFVLPAFVLGIGALIATNPHNSPAGRAVAAGVVLVLTLVIYPLQVRHLLRRRLLWAREPEGVPDSRKDE